MGRPKLFERYDVLSKSIQLFWRKGYSETTLQDLERATGVNKSGLYSEFRDKDDIFVQSLKLYSETNGAIEALSRVPLGRKNLEDFLLVGQRCSGQKGCFIANTVREAPILPALARREIQRHIASVRQAVLRNFEACKPKRDPVILTEMLLTFNSGLALRMNLGDIEKLDELVRGFLSALLK